MMKVTLRSALLVLVAVSAAIIALACSSEQVATPTLDVPTATASVVPATPTMTIVPTATVAVSAVKPPTATAAANSEPTPAVVLATPMMMVDPTSTVTVNGELESLSDRAYQLTIMLAEELSPRQSATEEELEAAMYLLGEMEELGYEVELQDFEVVEAFRGGALEVLVDAVIGEPNVVFSDADGDSPKTYFLPFEPLKSGRVRGELVFAGLGDVEGFEGVNVEGKIALMRRGTLSFEEKETNAAERGAIGAVVFNNEPRFLFGGRLEQEPDIFAGGISRTDGEKLRNALTDGEVVTVELLAYPSGNGPSRNVVAELNNEIIGDQVVLIGAHYDTTPWSPGANDNGSGVAAAMIIAEELTDDDWPFDVRVVFFGSEETGLHGSHHYAYDLPQEEIDRIAAMINLDVVGTGDLEAFGSEELTDIAGEVADDLDFELDISQGFGYAASDYAAFDERGVPYLMFFADDLRYVNHPLDTLEHVDPEPIGQTVAIVLELIDQLADSMEP